MRITRRALVWLLVLPQLLFLGLGGKLVLCVGQDGHVELESSASACCDVSVLGQSPEGMDPESVAGSNDEEQPSDCGPCTDLEIAFVREASPDSSSSGPFVPPLAAPSPELGTSRPRAVSHVLPRPPSVAPRLARMRGTVLRC